MEEGGNATAKVIDEGNNVTFRGDSYNYSFTDDTARRISYFFSQPSEIIALVLSITVITANLVSLCAIGQVRLRMTPHFRLIINLALADMLVGTSVFVHLVNRVFNPLYGPRTGPPHLRQRSRCAYVFIKALNTTALNIQLLNLLGMAMDHYLAMMRPLHYPQLMSSRRANAMIITLWCIALISGFSDYLSVASMPAQNERFHFNFCERIWLSPYNEEYTTFAIALVCLVIMSYIYTRIYWRVKKRQRRIPGEQQEMRRNQRALVTTLLILGTFAMCWLPTCLFEISLAIQVSIDQDAVSGTLLSVLQQAVGYLYDLLLLNAICDPIIYTLRMREVQHGYRRLCRRLCCAGFCGGHQPEETQASLGYSCSFTSHRTSPQTTLARGRSSSTKSRTLKNGTGLDVSLARAVRQSRTKTSTYV